LGTKEKNNVEAEINDEVLDMNDAGIDENLESAEEAIDPLLALQEEVAMLQDKLLRQHAEMENLRKRTEREVVDARKFAIEKFALSLLDVVDNLERAVETEVGNEEAVRTGVKLTLDAWHKTAEKFQLERIDAVGQVFDPHLHEALSKMPSEEDEGTVIAQHVAGYSLNGRLIRAAKVLVSSGKA